MYREREREIMAKASSARAIAPRSTDEHRSACGATASKTARGAEASLVPIIFANRHIYMYMYIHIYIYIYREI